MIIGTAGHIDHGKTALVRALTGVNTDRLKEEKARGISIDLGFAYQPTPDGDVLGFVDVPGHERFVRTMLAGAAGIDYVLLVVAADDGVMPQTREHLAILELLGVTRGVVALTKADLAAPRQRETVTAEVRAALVGGALATADIVPVSTVTGEGIAALGDRLAREAAAFTARDTAGRFRLAIDRSFTLRGAGTVVTGTVLSGSVTVGDHLIVSPSGLPVRVRSIHAQNRPAERGRAGERCALNLAGERVTREAFARGDVVLDPLLHAPAARIDATLAVLASEPRPIGQWSPVRLHTAAVEVGARVVLLGDGAILPGEEAFVQLVLERPVAAAVGDRYVLRDTSARRTIGGGRLVDLRAPARRRRTPQRFAQLAAQATGAPDAALAALLAVAPRVVELDGFGRDRALSDAQLEAALARPGIIRIATGGVRFALAGADWEALTSGLRGTLAAFHRDNPDLPGIGLERLRLQSEPRLPAPAFAAVLRGLARTGDVALDGAWVRLAGHEVHLTPADEAVWREIRPRLGGTARFRPPRVRDIAGLIGASEAEVRRLLKRVGRMGEADEVAHDHFFLRATVAELIDILGRLAAAAGRSGFTAAQFRDQVDSGRKVAIQILEFFDRHGVTLRRGDLRHIDVHRLDLFRPAGETEAPAIAGGEASPVGRPDFKSGRGRAPVSGGFDSHSPPPALSDRAR
ncbi:selenocysteine-specific translation factor [Chelatococcus reniformis]|uniref:Selenocysteine-specific elongation factor n=1 Tax=Chelatococcus reniformis TaxID=1494448 RepID=A0A916UKV3_9HYPH|nr:selenocysteine-specific translation factor [Chelatococcus reniformis]